jgi:hypothetical protein
VNWSATGLPANVSLSPISNAVILGGTISEDAVVQLTATLSQNTDVSWTTTVNLSAIPDTITFVGTSASSVLL